MIIGIVSIQNILVLEQLPITTMIVTLKVVDVGAVHQSKEIVPDVFVRVGWFGGAGLLGFKQGVR